MSAFTRKAILESFLRLAEKKPIEKITVRDLVDDCGINRNTFYYHYQDIYAVLEEICEELIERLPAEASLSATMTAFFNLMRDFVLAHPRAVKGMVMSLGYDGMERYFAPGLHKVILSCLMREAEHNGTVTRTYLQHVCTFFCHGIFGMCLDCLHVSKLDPTEIERDVARLSAAVANAVASADSDNF